MAWKRKSGSAPRGDGDKDPKAGTPAERRRSVARRRAHVRKRRGK